MKNVKKLLLSVLMVFAFSLAVSFTAMAANVSYSFTDSSITVNWGTPDLSRGSQVTSYSIYNYDTGTYIATGIPASVHSYTVSNLGKGYVGYWKITCDYKSSYGGGTDYYVGAVDVNTTPATPKKSEFGISSVYTSTNKVMFLVQRNSGMKGAQLELYKGNKKVGTYSFISYSDAIKVSNDAVYKYRVRAYYTNNDTKQTYYSAWSSFKYFDKCSGKVEYTYGKGGFDLTLKKVKNVKSYTIQVSKKRDSGFKKTATVKVSGKKKTVHINKIGKKTLANKTTYYVRIIPNIVVGSKTVKSEVIGTSSFYNSVW